VLFNRLNPISRNLDLPSRTRIIKRKMKINSAQQTEAQQELADLLIQPPVSEANDYGAYRAIAQVGKQSGPGSAAGVEDGKSRFGLIRGKPLPAVAVPGG
jgi:hypothetical protein